MVRRNDGSGLVSSRVELYEKSPKTPTYRKSTYRNSDSFAAPAFPVLEQRNVDEEENAYVGSSLIESGIQHHSQGEYEKALKAFGVALNTQRVSLGTNNIWIAYTRSCIGSVYLKQGQLVHAKKELEQAIEINKNLSKDRTSEAQDFVVANTLNNLGNIAALAGDLNASVDFYRQALQDLRQKSGSDKDIADVLFNLGRIQLQKQEFDTSMSNLIEASRMIKKLYSPKHILLAQTLSLIGIVHMSTKSPEAALISFLEAHEIYLALFGEVHKDVASSWYHIGLAQEAKELCKDAWESFTSARDIFTRLGIDQGDPCLKKVRRSISRVEQLIAQKNKPKDSSS
jgi:tetratricopeptide (TPR) repeat protein